MALAVVRNRRKLLTETSAAQYGLFSFNQAVSCGFDSQALGRALKSGWIERVHPTVYGIAGTPPSWERDLMAACLWSRGLAAVSHLAAATLWDLRGFSHQIVEISSALNRRAFEMPFRVHRVDNHLIPEIVTLKRLPVTSIRRTLLDVSGIKDKRAGRALDDALIRGLTTLGQMWLLYDEEWTRGRRGIAILRNLLIERTGLRAPTQSELESLFWEVVREHGLPQPESQFPITLADRTVHIDFAYPEARLLIECDGRAYHGDRKSFEEDRERDNELQALRWRVLRFTWAKLRFDRPYVAGLVKRHLDHASVSAP